MLLCCWVYWHLVLSWLNRIVLKSMCLLQEIFCVYIDSHAFSLHSVMYILDRLLSIARFILFFINCIWYLLFSDLKYFCRSYLTVVLSVMLVFTNTIHYVLFDYAIVLIAVLVTCHYLGLFKTLACCLLCLVVSLLLVDYFILIVLWCVYALILCVKHLHWILLV